MKQLSTQLMVVILLIFTQTTLKAQEEKDRVAIKRYMPVGDPNLNPNWDWTVSGSGHTVYYQTSNGINNRLIQVPFYTSGHPLNTVGEKDMYPEDGWVLAFRDFGTASAAPDMPFFALYNKYRGILRVMVYNSQSLSYNKFEMKLFFKSQSHTGGIFTFSAKEKAFLDDYDKTKSEIFLVEAPSFNGWIYADFQLFGYDPNMSSNTQLRLHINGINMSSQNLESTEFTLNEILSEANPGGEKSGGDLLGSLNKGSKYYKNVDKAAKNLRATVSKQESEGKDPWWKNILKSAVGTKSSPKGISKIAPIVGGLVGFFTSFIGGKDDPAPREPMNFEGVLKFKGTITTSPFPLYSIDFGLSEGNGANPPDYYRTVQPITWGVFSLSTQPIINKWHRCEEICWYDSHWDDWDCRDDYVFVYRKLGSFGYVFNPNANLQLVSVKLAYTYVNAVTSSVGPTPFYSISNFNNLEYEGSTNAVAVELVLKTKSPTKYYDNDIIVYKTYPFKTERKNIQNWYSHYCENNYFLSSDSLLKNDIRVSKEGITAIPNPAKNDLNIYYAKSLITNTKNINIHIYNFTGQQVATISGQEESSGIGKAHWDLLDNSGNKVPPGIYIYHVVTEQGIKKGKIVVE